ncbi:MAG: glutamine-hydrolyzing carbamoyl-phosphate synthase small subunit [Clostridia bacterium]|nr:glutamine-hydrolyzing carbamoyl-phosphate synthase small subunit [Clostridia bacterium]
MITKEDVKIVLEDGSEYCGFSFGAKCQSVCELVINTSMVGYQEIVSDPSCTYQMVVMTYPLIGNYGINDEDYETKLPTIGGLVVRDYNDMPSNFRYTKTLSEYMEDNNIPGIYGLDTRKLTRCIRDNGTMKVLICDIDTPHDEAMKILAETEIKKDAVAKVSCKKKWYSRTSNHQYDVVAVDCGIKTSIVKMLNSKGCNVTIVPYNTTAEEIEFMNPDGVLISNGPGSPDDIECVVELIKDLKGKLPIVGINMGAEMVAKAYGAKTYKMKFGHRGPNHPVKDLTDNCVEIVVQNHGYAIDADSIKDTELEITHINLLDNTVEGVACEKDRVYGVQYEPRNEPGPNGKPCFYDKFISILKEGK